MSILLNTSNIKTSCSACTLRELCLPVGVTEHELKTLDRLVNRQCKIRRGEYLHYAGSNFQALYAIRTGCFKTFVLQEDGREQITGFHITGELLGLDAISTEKHTCNAVALEDSEVCEVPFDNLEEMSSTIPSLLHRFHKIMSREIVRDHGMMLLLGSMKAEERLIIFLLDISRRLKTRGFSPSNFYLRMSRQEIGNYLGLKLETVSRILSKLQKEGFISVCNKHIQLTNIECLSRKIENPFCD